MSELLWFITHGIPVILGWEFGKWVALKIKMPYRWKCPECNFKVKTNNRETFEISKSSHNHITAREYR